MYGTYGAEERRSRARDEAARRRSCLCRHRRRDVEHGRHERLLERRVVVVVQVVDAGDGVAAREQPQRGVHADEAGRAGEQDVHGRMLAGPQDAALPARGARGAAGVFFQSAQITGLPVTSHFS